jgi:hypothetical protein
MVCGDLWDAVAPRVVLGYRCTSGNVCLACLAERTPGYRLYREDFNGLLRQPPCVEVEFGDSKCVLYALHFPSRRKNAVRAVRIKTEFHGNGAWTDADWDQAYDVPFDQITWLDDYCQALGLRLFIDGKEQDLGDQGGKSRDDT